jgi:hypothetical protein
MCLAVPHAARAGVVAYSWSGTLLPSKADDPWSIGPAGQEFELRALVQEDAPDYFNTNLEYSAYSLASAEFLLAGQPLAYIRDGFIDFTDNEASLYDIITFNGVFQRGGIEIELGSIVALLPDTFTLAQLEEPPPVFGMTTNATRAGCCGRTYASIVAPGVAVLAVPEPRISALAILSAMILPGFKPNRTRCAKRSNLL